MKTLWSSDNAFSRNDGLISADEQKQLATKRVVIPGCGGIGSTVAETLVRLGVGRFRLCDDDTFSVANFNRQMGATLETVGVNKAEATKQRILSINPNAEVELFPELISPDNAEAFVKDADVVLDGIDFFAIEARCALFAAARKAAIPAMTAAPLGFSSSMLIFTPDAELTFEEYFDFRASDNRAELLTKFLIGLAPKALHRTYMDLSKINAVEQTGPSSIIGTQLAATLIGAEVVRICLERGASLSVPWFRQFDAYRQCLVKKRLAGGNRHPLQRLKLAMAKQSFQRSGVWENMILAGAQ